MKTLPGMNSPLVGWLLAAAALALGYRTYGWPGFMLAVTAVVFWLLLQFSRALRTVRNAAGAPIGSVRSAVMFNARLRPGMTMPQVLALAGSLGRRLDAVVDAATAKGDETWSWQDEGNVAVDAVFGAGRLLRWQLRRPEDGGG